MFSAGKSLPLPVSSVCKLFSSSSFMCEIKCVETFHQEYQWIYVEKKNQLDATEWFFALIRRSTCFGHFYAHHHELETICLLLRPMVCSAWLLVVGGQVQSSRLCVQEEGCCTSCNIPLPELLLVSDFLRSSSMFPLSYTKAMVRLNNYKVQIIKGSLYNVTVRRGSSFHTLRKFFVYIIFL
jgi:hypothetical protein